MSYTSSVVIKSGMDGAAVKYSETQFVSPLSSLVIQLRISWNQMDHMP